MSFTITVVAFAVTVGWSVVTQRAAAQHSEELATGYVPVALKLGQLRATQATLSTLIDGIPDERNPIAMRTVLQTLVAARRTKFLDTRVAVEQGLGSVGSAQATALAARLSGELKTVEQSLDGDLADFDRLFAAIAAGDRGEAERVRTIVGATEHDAERRLHQAADDVSQWMTVLSEDARVRERRAIVALVALAVLTLGVGVAVSIHTRRLLAPLQTSMSSKSSPTRLESHSHSSRSKSSKVIPSPSICSLTFSMILVLTQVRESLIQISSSS